LGPWYEGGCVVQLAAKKTCALVEYEHVVRVQSLVPHNPLLPGQDGVGAAPTLKLGAMEEPGFIPEGTLVDAHARVLILSPQSCKALCSRVRGRAPNLQTCAIALPLSLTLALGVEGVEVSVGLDFWVQVLEPKSSQVLYAAAMYQTSQSVHAPYPRNPLPRLVLPADSTSGKEGMALYTGARAALAVECGTTQEVTMQVRGLPSLAGLAVNRLHPTVLTKAVPVDALMSSAGVQSIGDAKVPVQLVEAMPTQWQPWDAWNATSVTVTEDQVVVKLAPACGVMASVGLHMVCLQISYALDDACMSAAGEAGCQPSNFGCRLENPDAPGRCFVTTAPSRCIHYMVTDAGAAPVAHHTVSPPATPPPPPPPPAPALQPELVRVGEPDEPVLHGNTSVHHVLDFPRGLQLPDPHVQIKRLPAPEPCAVGACPRKARACARQRAQDEHAAPDNAHAGGEGRGEGVTHGRCKRRA